MRLREARTGRSGHEHFPGLIVPMRGATNTAGGACAFHYGWSGGHRMVAEELPDGQRQIQFGNATGTELEPRQTYETATLFATWSDEGLNGCATAFQRHLRDRIVTWPKPAAPRPVHYNCWEAVYLHHDLDTLTDIATRAAGVARSLGLEPRVAFVSFSTFGYPVSERAQKMHLAPDVLDRRGVDFEYEGEMTVDVALNANAAAHYPFSRLTGPANILVVPARHSASISVKLMQEMAGATVIGPILTGVPKPIQILSTGATVNDIMNMAVMAACRVGLAPK